MIAASPTAGASCRRTATTNPSSIPAARNRRPLSTPVHRYRPGTSKAAAKLSARGWTEKYTASNQTAFIAPAAIPAASPDTRRPHRNPHTTPGSASSDISTATPARKLAGAGPNHPDTTSTPASASGISHDRTPSTYSQGTTPTPCTSR